MNKRTSLGVGLNKKSLVLCQNLQDVLDVSIDAIINIAHVFLSISLSGMVTRAQVKVLMFRRNSNSSTHLLACEIDILGIVSSIFYLHVVIVGLFPGCS